MKIVPELAVQSAACESVVVSACVESRTQRQTVRVRLTLVHASTDLLSTQRLQAAVVGISQVYKCIPHPRQRPSQRYFRKISLRSSEYSRTAGLVTLIAQVQRSTRKLVPQTKHSCDSKPRVFDRRRNHGVTQKLAQK